MIDTKIAKPIKNFSGCGCTSVPKYPEPSVAGIPTKQAKRVTGAYGSDFSSAYNNMGVRPDRTTVSAYTRKVKK